MMGQRLLLVVVLCVSISLVFGDGNDDPPAAGDGKSQEHDAPAAKPKGNVAITNTTYLAKVKEIDANMKSDKGAACDPALEQKVGKFLRYTMRKPHKKDEKVELELVGIDWTANKAPGVTVLTELHDEMEAITPLLNKELCKPRLYCSTGKCEDCTNEAGGLLKKVFDGITAESEGDLATARPFFDQCIFKTRFSGKIKPSSGNLVKPGLLLMTGLLLALAFVGQELGF